MSLKTSELLEQAKSLIDKPDKWTRLSYAKTKLNRPTQLNDPGAAKFCAVGAVKRVAALAEVSSNDAVYALDEVAFDIYGHCTITINDTMGHEVIMRLYDEAIWRALLSEGNVLPLNPPGESK